MEEILSKLRMSNTLILILLVVLVPGQMKTPEGGKKNRLLFNNRLIINLE